MRSRGTFVKTLLALLVAGGLWGVIYHREYRGDLEAPDDSGEKDALAFDRDKVRALEIARPDTGAIALEKEGKDWRITAPIQARADSDKVDSILSSLDFLRVEQAMADVPESELASFKLDHPAASITVKSGGEPADASLRIGDKAPVGTGHYASRPGTPGVVVVSGGLDGVLSADLASLRFKKVVGVDSWQLQRFRIEAAGAVLSVARQEEVWRLESPLPFPADGTKIQDLWYSVQAQEAEAFETEQPSDRDLARFGLDRPVLTLAVEPKEGPSPIRIAFGRTSTPQAVYARRSDMPPVMRVQAELLDKLQKALAGARDLRDVRVAPVERWKVSAVEIRRGGGASGAVTIVKNEESSWRWGGTEGPEVPAADVNGLLDAVEQLKASEFVDDPGAAAQTAPALTLVLREGEGEEARSLTAVVLDGAGPAAGTRRLSSSASASVYVVASQAVESLLERAGALKEPAARAGAGADSPPPASADANAAAAAPGQTP